MKGYVLCVKIRFIFAKRIKMTALYSYMVLIMQNKKDKEDKEMHLEQMHVKDHLLDYLHYHQIQLLKILKEQDKRLKKDIELMQNKPKLQ